MLFLLKLFVVFALHCMILSCDKIIYIIAIEIITNKIEQYKRRCRPLFMKFTITIIKNIIIIKVKLWNILINFNQNTD